MTAHDDNPSGPPKPGQKRSTSELVAGAIRERIMRGEIAAGRRLTEERLAQDMEVSRGPIREALRHLAEEGLVVLIPNKGATVRPVTRKWLTDHFEVREMLEGFAARKAAESVSDPKDVAWFAHELDVWSDPMTVEDPALFFEANIRFHQGMMARCGNTRLPDFMPKLRAPVPVHLAKFFDQHDEQRRLTSAEDHAGIARAIIARDPTGAETLARYHIRRTAMLLAAMPASAFSD